MAQAFTPAPWEVDIVQDAGITTYALAKTQGGEDGREAEANASLIAASPTMYDYIKRRAGAGDTEAKQILKTVHVSR